MNELRYATPVLFSISVFCASAGIPTKGHISLYAVAHSASGGAAYNPAVLPFGKNNSSNQFLKMLYYFTGGGSARPRQLNVSSLDELPKDGSLASSAR